MVCSFLDNSSGNIDYLYTAVLIFWIDSEVAVMFYLMFSVMTINK